MIFKSWDGKSQQKMTIKALIKVLAIFKLLMVTCIDSKGDIIVFPDQLNDRLKLEAMDRKPQISSIGTIDRPSISACKLYSQLSVSLDVNSRIIDGLDTYPSEIPYMAALGYIDETNKTSFACGGAIISELFILTAAHCVLERHRPTFVRLGRVNLKADNDEDEPVDIIVKQVIRHPDFQRTLHKNDIALLKLENKIEFLNRVRPACLYADKQDLSPNVDLTIAGWGTRDSEVLRASDILLKKYAKTIPLQACNTTLLEYNQNADIRSLRKGIHSSQYCTYDSSCQGDSGGPMVVHNSTISTIVGVLSFGVGCNNSLPTIYSRVAYYLDWIEHHVWPLSI